MPKASPTAAQQRFLAKFGAEIREYRDLAGMSGRELGDYMDWNRDAISKIEGGVNNMSVYDYLRMVVFLREIMPPDHPALAMADRFIPRPGKSRK